MCLGPRHARLALIPQALCPYCAHLSVEEKAAASGRLHDTPGKADCDDSLAKCVSFTIEEALKILDSSGPDNDRSTGEEFSDLASSIAGSPPDSPLLPVEDMKYYKNKA